MLFELLAHEADDGPFPPARLGKRSPLLKHTTDFGAPHYLQELHPVSCVVVGQKEEREENAADKKIKLHLIKQHTMHGNDLHK